MAPPDRGSFHVGLRRWAGSRSARPLTLGSATHVHSRPIVESQLLVYFIVWAWASAPINNIRKPTYPWITHLEKPLVPSKTSFLPLMMRRP